MIVLALGPVILTIAWWLSVLLFEARFRTFNNWGPLWKTNAQGRDVQVRE
jgi:hypothetical protein